METLGLRIGAVVGVDFVVGMVGTVVVGVVVVGGGFVGRLGLAPSVVAVAVVVGGGESVQVAAVVVVGDHAPAVVSADVDSHTADSQTSHISHTAAAVVGPSLYPAASASPASASFCRPPAVLPPCGTDRRRSWGARGAGEGAGEEGWRGRCYGEAGGCPEGSASPSLRLSPGHGLLNNKAHNVV